MAFRHYMLLRTPHLALHYILSSICSLISTTVSMLCCTIAVYPFLTFGCIPRYLGNGTNIIERGLFPPIGTGLYVRVFGSPGARYVSLCTLLDRFPVLERIPSGTPADISNPVV